MRSRCFKLISIVFLTIASYSLASAGEMRRVVSDYEVTPIQGSGIIRAFYYGARTVIEMESPPSALSVVDGNGVPIEFEPEGRFIRLIDRPAVFTLSFSGKAATFRSLADVARLPKPSPEQQARYEALYAQPLEPVSAAQFSNAIPVAPSAPAVSQLPTVSALPVAPVQAQSNVAQAPQETLPVQTTRSVKDDNRPGALPVAPVTPAPVAAVASKTFSAPAKELPSINLTAQPSALGEPVVPLPEFTINAGERIKPALTRWLSTIDYTLAWEATSSTPGRMRDIVYSEAMTKKCNTIQELLLELLDGYSLKVFVSEQERKVVVRNEDNSTR